uniref:Uncharacterized protein n=1 Tax=Anguilla anguilla TaxID=7936 RepID=A0A0E9SVP5_ANGAN
MSDSMAIC